MKKFHFIALICLLACGSANYSAAKKLDMSWDIFSSFEEILLRTDCIVIATVETTKTERIFQYNRDTLTRFTTLRVNEVVKSDKTLKNGDVFTLETYEGMYKKNEFIEPYFKTHDFSTGREVLLLLIKRDGKYFLVY
jgi:hypothetical protein